MLWICLKEDVCLYRPNARWEEEFVLSKEHSWRIAENCLVSGSENLKKKLSNSTYITTCCLGGFQEKWSSLMQKQTPAYSVVRQDWNFKWVWLLWSDETKKNSFLVANTQDGFGEHRDKKYLMCTIKYTAVLFMLWAYISDGGPGHLD